MNVVEIEEAVAAISAKTFEAGTFFFDFMAAYGAAPMTITRLQKGETNKSDITGAWLWRLWMHAKVCAEGQVGPAMENLKASRATARGKARYIMATDGVELAAEDLKSGDTLYCALPDLEDHFAFFLPLAGYERYAAAEENPIDVRATGRLSKLYDALLAVNEDWKKPERRHDMNQFMTRIIFCLFAEDTGIFPDQLFSKTITEMGERDGSNVQHVLQVLFRTMNLAGHEQERADQPAWAQDFPYVNGGLFSGTPASPVFNKTAYRYLLDAAGLNWKEINPDIFGSMIQSIVDTEQRSELGMHYTSVPNILKVLDPLFLDDLRSDLRKAWNSERKLLKLLARMERMRIFDPACGSGNFLVIAYRELRVLEIEILKRLAELTGNTSGSLFSQISLSNLYGIEYTDFAAETAKLSLWVAEYQMNKRFEEAFGTRQPDLPLRDSGNIVCGNALRMDWNEVCPPAANQEVETYLVGNPPYLGHQGRSEDQKKDMQIVFQGRLKNWGELDYVACWFSKASDYCRLCNLRSGNSVGGTAELQLLGTPYGWSSIHPGGPITPQET